MSDDTIASNDNKSSLAQSLLALTGFILPANSVIVANDHVFHLNAAIFLKETICAKNDNSKNKNPSGRSER